MSTDAIVYDKLGIEYGSLKNITDGYYVKMVADQNAEWVKQHQPTIDQFLQGLLTEDEAAYIIQDAQLQQIVEA